MADRELLDAILRLEAQNREDHQVLQSQIRGFAGRMIKAEGDIDALAGLMRERNESCLRRHKRLDHKSWAVIILALSMAMTAIAKYLGVIR